MTGAPVPACPSARRDQLAPDFFVVGSVRTGSTLLRLMLGHHPRVCRCDEMEYLVPGIEMQSAGRPIEEYRDFLRYDRIFQLSGFDVPGGADLRELGDDLFRQLAERNPDCDIAGATVHNDFAHLASIWPQAKFIFLDRDPRDVAFSVMNLGWAGTGWYAAQFWVRAKANWERVCAATAPGQRLEIRFEDLVAAPEPVLHKVCDFLDIAFSPAMLEIERDTTYRRPSARAAASWEQRGRQRDIAEVETRIGRDRIAAAGYPLSDYPDVDSGALAMAGFALRDLWHRTRYRIRQYGLYLWLASALSKRSGSQAWRRSVQLRLDAIDNAHLK
ncbi:sulfotransferase [Mangrovimicrobium sediminis]|uniref:Sulfotransferase n=1 Tax=Mangrovimicrobium sediminis TaxID=2562682 RepID=A0A4Z0M368_9GAMM|nr:sulfotransferase [Haliea sp. SAOS-164]TGD73951.1 sulfotransferase [Haliea sp. SAOS-164]